MSRTDASIRLFCQLKNGQMTASSPAPQACAFGKGVKEPMNGHLYLIISTDSSYPVELVALLYRCISLQIKVER